MVLIKQFNMKWFHCLIFLATCAFAIAAPANSSKIVGGSYVDITSVPYQLQLQTVTSANVGYMCGGSIISDQWALTAGHCLSEAVSYVFRAGSSIWGSGGTTHIGILKIIHPLYYPKVCPTSNPSCVRDYDIAVAKVSPSFPIGRGASIIKLASYNPYVGYTLVNSGWGRTSGSDINSASTYLKAAALPVISNAQCVLQRGSQVTSRNICAGNSVDESCGGDSGGPLVDYYPGIQYGINSWGSKYCTPPSVFTSVAYFRSWIFQQTGV